MKLKDLFEARSNPNHPSQRKQVDMEPFEKYINLSKDEQSNLFVSFTEINKLGINPRTRNKRNPAGIYTYPLSTILDSKAHKMNMAVPFAGGAKYVWIVKPTGSVINLNRYGDDELKRDISTISQYVSKVLDLPFETILSVLSKGSSDYPGMTFWEKVTKANRLLSMTHEDLMWVKDKISKFDSEFHIGMFMRFTGGNIPFNSNRMNFLLRKVLGYSAIYDPSGSILGKGGRAKEQCVFLSTEAYKIVDHFTNTSVDGNGLSKMSDKVRNFIKQPDVQSINVFDEFGELGNSGNATSYQLYIKPIDSNMFEYAAISDRDPSKEFMGKIDVSDKTVPSFIRQAIQPESIDI